MAIDSPIVFPPHGLQSITSAPSFGAAVSLNATSGSDLGFVWRAPQADTITGLKFKLTAVTGTPGVLRVSAQSVSTTTGLNSGTLLGATNNAKLDFTPVAGDIGVYSATFAESFTVAAGDVLAFVVKPQSGTWDGSNLVQCIYRIASAESNNTPYAISNAAKTTNGVQQLIVVGAARSYECCVLSLGNSGNLASGGSPNEVGTYFVAPSWALAADCIGVEYGGALTSSRSFEVRLYDSSTNVLASCAIDTDQLLIGNGRHRLPFTSKVALTPGTAYHVSVIATHATGSTTVYQYTWNSSGDRAAYITDTAYHAQRAGSTWTYDQAKLSCVFPVLANMVSTSAGGGMGNVFGGGVVR